MRSNSQIPTPNPPAPAHASAAFPRGVAEILVNARQKGIALAGFPGTLPRTLADAYVCQDQAIALWSDQICGWKVGFVQPAARDESGDERVLGPIFKGTLVEHFDYSTDSAIEFAVIPGGFAAIEAEYVFKLGVDLTSSNTVLAQADTLDWVESLHVGVEFAGSPMPDINRVGLLSVASDFGNNSGLVVGPEISDWRHQHWHDMQAQCWINGNLVGKGGAASVPGSPLGALRFAVQRLLKRGLSLPKGTWIATGASTGIHEVVPGDQGEIRFEHGNASDAKLFSCRITARTPESVEP